LLAEWTVLFVMVMMVLVVVVVVRVVAFAAALAKSSSSRLRPLVLPPSPASSTMGSMLLCTAPLMLPPASITPFSLAVLITTAVPVPAATAAEPEAGGSTFRGAISVRSYRSVSTAPSRSVSRACRSAFSMTLPVAERAGGGNGTMADAADTRLSFSDVTAPSPVASPAIKPLPLPSPPI
jgi:hypothetical protein